jgi:phosphatidylinositol alpha-1,6-mannosyltransferase
MKTLIITLEYPPQIGGIASYAYNLAAHLPSGETCVWAPVMPGAKEFDAGNPWSVYRGKPYFAFFWPRWLRWYWQISKIVKREKIERLMIQHVLPGGYIGYLIKKFMKVPYVVFFHGSDLEIGLKRKMRKINMVCRFADQVIVNSEFLKNKLIARAEGFSNVTVVHPGPGDNFFEPVPDGAVKTLKSQLALEGKSVMISVGRLAEGKGFPRLMQLLPAILSEVPNATLLIIGDGPKKNVVIEIIQKNNLQNVVRYIGELPNCDLPKYYHAADVFVLLTHRDEKTEEGWGTVYMEAAACGLPVVAGNVGGVEEAVENLVTGVLVDPNQDSQVVSTIVELLKKRDYARQMGKAGRVRAEENFRWDKQIKLITG